MRSNYIRFEKDSSKVLLVEASAHEDGPILQKHANNHGQYEALLLKGIFLSKSFPNKCINCGNVIGLIRNFIVIGDNVKCIFKSFKRKESFFTYSLQSSQLDVFYVSQLSNKLCDVSVSAISCKFVMLPFSMGYVVISLIM